MLRIARGAASRLHAESNDAALSAPRRARSRAELQRCLLDERAAVVSAACDMLSAVESDADRTELVSWVVDALRTVHSDEGSRGDRRRACLVRCAANVGGSAGLVAVLRVCPGVTSEAAVDALGATMLTLAALRSAPHVVAFVRASPLASASAKAGVATAAMDAADALAARAPAPPAEVALVVAQIACAALRDVPAGDRVLRSSAERAALRAAHTLAMHLAAGEPVRKATFELRDCAVARVGELLQRGRSALRMLRCVAALTTALQKSNGAGRDGKREAVDEIAARPARARRPRVLVGLAFLGLVCATTEEAAAIAAIVACALCR
jgi:hypothetical protein